MVLTDSSGNVQIQYKYGVFGNTQVIAGTQSSNDNPYQYGGREADPVSGMYYLRGRYLDTGLARFVSRDPAGFQDGGICATTSGWCLSQARRFRGPAPVP